MKQKPGELTRAPRLPLFVPLTPAPAAADMWSVDLSATGLGFVARDAGGLNEGHGVHLTFGLPDVVGDVQVRGTVAWLHQTPGAGVTGGVAFSALSAEARLRITQYLSGHRVHVGVFGADVTQGARVSRAVGEQVQLHWAQTFDDLYEVLGRGDLSAMVMFGSAGSGMPPEVDEVARLAARPQFAPTDPLHDTLPRVVVCADVDPAEAVSRFNRAGVFRVLPGQATVDEIAAAVEQALRDFGVRAEHARALLALQRGLARSRRPAAPVASTGPLPVAPQSASMRAVLDQLDLVAPHRASVLLQGETGTGKEVLARYVHETSTRRDQPIVVQDCGTLTETLLESELFGHVKGAFTGATANHPGLFTFADAGTVFLDEIENMSPQVQTKLLRVLETGEVRPVGGTQVRRVDVRVIAATNRRLAHEVAAGRFRADLYYRLAVFPVAIPALRDRTDDIIPLARHFLAGANREMDKRVDGLSPEAEQAMLQYDWPGNVRELRNAIERAVLLSRDDRPIPRGHLPEAIVARPAARAAPGPGGGSFVELVAEFEAAVIEHALAQHRGIARRAARALSMNPVTLGRKIKRYGIDPDALGG